MFGRRFPLFRIIGFEIRIDASWFFIAVLVTWSLAHGFFPSIYEGLAHDTYWLMGVAGALGLFFSIIFHELSHALVARRYGMRIEGITLFIFGGVAEMQDEAPSAKTEFLVAVAGPIASVLLAAGFYGLYSAGRGNGWSDPLTGVLNYLALINGLLAAFNMLPAFPLDGGRVLRAALWSWKGSMQRATRTVSQVGAGFGVVMIVLGLLSILSGNLIGGMWWALIGLFLRNAAQMSYQQVLLRRYLEGEKVRRFMSTDPVTVPASISVRELVEDYVYRFHFKMFPVVEGGRLVGCVTTQRIKEIPNEQWDSSTVREFAEPYSDRNTISPGADATAALALMNRTGASRLMVANGDRLVGVLALKDLMKFLSLKIDLEGA
jgi:Zn-dependent protease/CBS domain-containing protein